MQSNDYALVIGINDYPSYRPLRGAIRDAQAVAEWLRSPVHGGALPAENVSTIVSTSNPPVPLQDQVDDALREILAAARASGGRRFYFYFSGHGFSSDVAHDVVLCLAKWSEELRHLALSSNRYQDLLVRSGIFSEIVFFLDCCRIWKVRAAGQKPYIDVVSPGFAASGARVFVAYGAGFDSYAMEAGSCGDATDSGEFRGIFTEALLSGLRGAAATERGEVTATSLKHYLEVATPRLAANKGFEQRAEVLNGLPSAPEPIFGRASPMGKLVIQFHKHRSGQVILEGPFFECLRRGDATTGPWEIDLPRGLYRLMETATGQGMILEYARDTEVTHVYF